MAAKKKLTFEERLAQVETLISGMESGTMGLEEALKRYEEGMEALTALEKELQSAQQRLTVLRSAPDGTEEELPLEVEE